MSQPGHSIGMSDAEFQHIVAIAASEAGLAIPETKKSLVQSRVARRMRALGLETCATYLSALSHDTDETQHLISALTTNVSHFFRERHHFDHIRDMLQAGLDQRRWRFWSAGCSNGQEPYSLAMEIAATLKDSAQRDIRILATDIDRSVLKKAKAGIYDSGEIDGVPADKRSAFLEHQTDGSYKVKKSIQDMVKFGKLNLNADGWPMKGPFNAIMCRNVVIYFDEDTQSRLWPRFHRLLEPGGILMLGHSERIHPLAGSGFEAVGVTTYRRI